jgi:hypothetical protein
MTRPAELSSLTSSLDELVRRITVLAEGAQREGDDETAIELFAAERAIGGALRRLRRFEDAPRR